MGTTAVIVSVVLVLPISPLATVFDFTAMPLALYGAIIGVVVCYVVSAEVVKHWFYRTYKK